MHSSSTMVCWQRARPPLAGRGPVAQQPVSWAGHLSFDHLPAMLSKHIVCVRTRYRSLCPCDYAHVAAIVPAFREIPGTSATDPKPKGSIPTRGCLKAPPQIITHLCITSIIPRTAKRPHFDRFLGWQARHPPVRGYSRRVGRRRPLLPARPLRHCLASARRAQLARTRPGPRLPLDPCPHDPRQPRASSCVRTPPVSPYQQQSLRKSNHDDPAPVSGPTIPQAARPCRRDRPPTPALTIGRHLGAPRARVSAMKILQPKPAGTSLSADGFVLGVYFSPLW